MKKLKLSEVNLGDAEVLTREQLKKVLGGMGSGGSGGTCNFSINCVFENGTGSGGTCTGSPDASGDCFPAEQQCYEDANSWCDSTPGCYSCVPY